MNDHTELHHDLAIQNGLESGEVVPSASILCRFETHANQTTGLRLHQLIIDRFPALDPNIPIMIFSTPDEEMDDMDESDLMGFGMQKMMETGDLPWSGYYAIAKSYLRAITPMQILPDIRAKKAVLLGCSKRGLAESICAGADPGRVAGRKTLIERNSRVPQLQGVQG